MSELHEVNQAEVPFATFDAADIVAMQSSLFRQFFLR